jgi:hypothetical protein
VIETLTTGCMIPRGLIVHQQRYRPRDRNTDYWVYDIDMYNVDQTYTQFDIYVLFLQSRGRYLCWWTISPRGIIHPVVSVSITWSISLLVDY